MKLIELLEYQFPQIKVKNVKKIPDQYHYGNPDISQSGLYKPDYEPPLTKRNKNVKHLGSGYFSSAYSHKDKPQDIRKVSRPAAELRKVDGFYFYILELSKFHHNENIYFPRFRDITVYKTPNGELAYSVSMERLVPFDDIPDESITPTLQKILGEHITKELIGRAKQYYAPKRILIKLIQYLIDNVNFNFFKDIIPSSEIKEVIQDKDLIEAVKFIKYVENKHSIGTDLHPGNIMFRRTPYGVQPVITDPLAFQY